MTRVFVSQPSFYMGRRQAKMHAIDVSKTKDDDSSIQRIRLTAVYKDNVTDELKQGHCYLEFNENDFHDLMFSIMPFSNQFNRDTNEFVEIRVVCKWHEWNVKNFLKSMKFFQRKHASGKEFSKLVPYRDAHKLIVAIIGKSVEVQKEISIVYSNYLRFDNKLFKEEIEKNASKG